MLTYGIDWDDVISDLNTHAIQLANGEHGLDLKLEDINSWENVGKASVIKQYYQDERIYRMQTVTDEARNFIHELQKKIIEHLESANAKQSAQLDILHNLFASNEDQAMVAKAIMRIMQTQLDETSPIKNLIIDKGLDFLIAMLPALVTYLKNQGICL